MIARRVAEQVEGGWVRRMFAEALRMKAERGEENVFDYSIGNPTAPPPLAVTEALRTVAAGQPDMGHSYMPNAGYPAVRQAVATQLQHRTGLPYTADHILMTVGAAGALNQALKAILDLDDEVIVPVPYFAEYLLYVENHGGRVVFAETTPDFQLDPEAIARALSPRTKAILLNSPNNPTGAVYAAAALERLEGVLAQHHRRVLVISDEPYREIVHGRAAVPEMPSLVTNCAVAYSWSKTFGLAGERIGYLAISPRIPEASQLAAACAFACRALGYVNAPATWQWVAGKALNTPAEAEEYRVKVARICDGLERIGYELLRPGGGFYVFPRTPIADDVAFVGALQQQGILAVPGITFGRTGHMRLSLTLEADKVERSLPGFERAFREARSSPAALR